MKVRKTVRYEVNPFLIGMEVPVKDKRVNLSVMGSGGEVWVNQVTGEVSGTHVTTYKTVDNAQFIKLFSANIALTFNLISAGIKAFSVLVWILQQKGINRDLVTLDKFALDDFLSANDDKKLKLSMPTFARGLADLEKAKIIAKHIRAGWYFVNPNFIFNGDRIAFTTVIERRKKDAERDPKTIDFINGKPDSEL